MQKFTEWLEIRESGARVSPSFTDPAEDRPEPPDVSADEGIALDGSDKPPVHKKKKKKDCKCNQKKD